MQIKSRIHASDFFFFFGNVGPGNIGKLGGATWIWDGRCEIFPLVDRLSRDVKKIGKMKFSVKDHKVVCECLSIYKSYDTVYYDINSDNQFRYMRNLISFIEQPLSFFFFLPAVLLLYFSHLVLHPVCESKVLSIHTQNEECVFF